MDEWLHAQPESRTTRLMHDQTHLRSDSRTTRLKHNQTQARPEKTQENWVFSRFCILRCKIIAFFHKKLGFFMQNCIFSLQIATKNSKIHIQVCICNLSLILFPKTVLFLFMMSRLYLFQYYYF